MTDNIKADEINIDVSVILPVYNDRLFLKEAVESIYSQTFQNYELIIIDSSTDLSIWDDIDIKRENTKYYWIEKNGIANALNWGIEHAKGKYIARMDADDVSLPERFEKQVSYLEEHSEIMLLGTGAYNIDEFGITKSSYEPECDKMAIKCMLFFRNAFYHPTVMFRKEVFSNLKYSNQHTAEDYDLWTKIALVFPMANISDKLLKYRTYGTNSSTLLREKVAMSVSRSSREYIKNMFDLDMSRFEIDDTSRYIDAFESVCDLPMYIQRQIELLRMIWERNCTSHILEEQYLQKEINLRWIWNISRYDNEEVIDNKKFYIFDMYRYQKNEHFILDDIYIYNDSILELIEYVEKRRQMYLKTEKTFLLYGLGIRGERFINQYIRKDSSDFKWKLVGISDQNRSRIEINGSEFETIQLDVLKDFDVDYIIVTPKNFLAIREDLIARGVSASKIVNASMWIG